MATKLSFESRSLYRCLSIICCPWGGEGDFEVLRGDFAIWTCCQAMNTQPLRAHTHTHLSPGSSPARSPPCCPAAEQMSPDAPVLQLALLFLLTSLPWQCQARALSAPDHSQAEPGSFAGAQQHLSSQGRGTRLSPRAAVRSLHGSSRQSRVLLAG